MTQIEFLQGQIEWADKWLATPASELVGALTHDKCAEVREQACEALSDLQIEKARFSVTETGMKFSHYAA